MVQVALVDRDYGRGLLSSLYETEKGVSSNFSRDRSRVVL